ncbi:NAD-dependent deacylase [Alicyclobacillus sp. SO9]|uniref:SIR2 family NAD-dependent protein deacylase n=1 Tax=Alicyclobacillus sp. SO9 TaxID=2665646 RepID=UPI0018E72313|nr:NAD-dependent deacylase [Alicyclobacillus sp. SO9]QQE79043.1 NAD-dependent deacylase [Alicyclobacillus sp. SO9]
MSREAQVLARWLTESEKTVVLTGAGISTESGVPDLRTKSGWWKSINPASVATAETVRENYLLFRDFYSHRISSLQNLQPNLGHRILADWERRGLISAIATQNVDGFHQSAGSKTVYELHGSIHRCYCHSCRAETSIVKFLTGQSCTYCGGVLRPGVVLFDESVPEDTWHQALRAISAAHLVLVIGTSLNVYPVNRLLSLTAGKRVAINAEETESHGSFDLVLHSRAGEYLRKIDNLLAESNPSIS